MKLFPRLAAALLAAPWILSAQLPDEPAAASKAPTPVPTPYTHTHARAPFMEKPFAQWTADEQFANTYFWIDGNWPAFALAALQMKAKAAWNHDAFFDFCDWWMWSGAKKYYSNDGHTGPTRNNTDKFVQAMWDAHRAQTPAQPGGADNLKWVWTDGKPSADGQHFYASKGHFVPNPKAL